MSATIDERVVSMQFDNKHFERNVQTTMSTLDKLKQKLNLKGVEKGFENIDAASKKVNMSGLTNALETVKGRFSALEVMAITTLANITNSAVNAGKRIVSALTIDPIKTGFAEYETQINAIQTILANTQSKGTTINDVNSALDELNTYADKTIYNFTEMTRNIGTFTAAGVDLNKSVTSIKGIANLAAVSGSSAQQASNAMYQLSQALAAGRVSLMDWNSVVNAGMGGQVFQDALKRTATQMGHNVDAMIEKYGSFRESLTQGEWLTAEVLTETLTQLSGAYSKADLIAQGYTEEQAEQIDQLAKTAEGAATNVKTFTQLWDTLKESAQSGWTQTWEILVGDFEEAKAMLTEVSKVIGKMIGDSAEARNNLLQGWKDAGGRNDLLEGFKNAFNGIMAIITPIKNAFRDIFPPTTVDQLLKFTEGFKNLTASFAEFTSSHGDQIYSTFKGIFSAIDIGVTFVKDLASGVIKLIGKFTGLGGSVLDITGSIGDWLTNLRDSVKETDLFGKAIDSIVGFLEKAIDKLKEFARFAKDKIATPGWEGFLSLMSSIWDVMQKIGAKISSIASSIGSALANAFRSGDIASGLDVINGGLLTSVLLGIKKFMKGMEETAEESEGFMDKIKGCLDGVKDSLEAWQQNLKADTLLKLAGAIGILAASLLLIAAIKPEKLNASLGAITVLFGELLGSLAIFNKLDGTFTGTGKAVVTMIGMSTAILILAGALRAISSLSWSELGVALTGLTVTLAALIGAVKIMETGTNIASGAGQMLIMAGALTILAGALKIVATMSWGELAVGLTGLTVTLAALIGAVKILETGKTAASGAGQMVLMAGALTILAGALKIIATMSWGELAVGLTGLTVTLGVMVGALAILNKMKNSMVGSAAAITIISGAMVTLAGVLKIIATMSWSELGVGLAGLAGSLAVMVGALAILDKMKYSMIGSSSAILIMAAAIAVLTPSLKALGSMSIGEIIKSLVTLAATFAVIGVAGYLLAPITPAILAFSGAVALLGLACLGVGAGVALFAAALGALSTITAASATAIVAALTIIVTGIAGLIPAVIQKIGEGIIVFCEVIAGSAESIGKAVKAVVLTLIDVIIECAPAIADGLFELIIAALNIFANRMPELIQAAVDAFMAFFSSVVDALRGMDTSTLIQGIIGVGLLAGLIAALGAIVGLIPGAMVGVLGMGVVIAELAIVLAAVGALAQIPGLEWLISEGGDFLQTIGTAIGQFIGGIAGGIAKGATAALPAIGSDLSMFMMNAMPFITGAKLIDSKVADGVKSLAEVILILTGANILDGLTSWFTGGTSIVDFGKDLAKFGPYFKQYYNSIKGVDSDVIQASANAAKALAEMASNLPNSGGLVSLFTGDNSLASFAEELVPFGKSMKKYADEVSGINPAVVVSSANAAKALSELANNLPNTGGMVSWFTGDNDLAGFGTSLVSFGENFAKYSEHMKGVDAGVLTASTNAAKSIVELQKSLPKEGGWFSDDMSLSDFGKDMSKFGEKLGEYYASISSVDAGKMSSVITETNRLVSMLKGMSGISADGASAFTSALKTLAQNGVDGFVNAFANAHSRASTAVTNFMNAAVQGITSKQGQFTSAGQVIITNLIAGIRTGGTSVPIIVSNIISSALIRITGKAGEFAVAGRTLVTNLSVGMTSTGTMVATAITTMIDGTLARIKVKSMEFNSVGQMLMTNFIAGIRSRGSGISTAFVSVAAGALTALRNQYSNFYNAGSYVAQGFANGINGSQGLAAIAGTNLGQAAYNAAMAKINAQSPSRLFMEVGSYVAQGFAIGIQDDTPLAASAASDMATSTIDVVKSAISRLSDAINVGIDTQPTIRPVLDLTNVEAGAHRLQAIFSRDQALSIKSSMERANSVATNVEVPTAKTGNTYQFTQINNSPKALSRTEIYRQTSNQFSAFERMVEA